MLCELRASAIVLEINCSEISMSSSTKSTLLVCLGYVGVWGGVGGEDGNAMICQSYKGWLY